MNFKCNSFLFENIIPAITRWTQNLFMTLCDLKKGEITKKPAKVLSLIDDPSYICAKCLRQANDKKNLCSAMPLTKLAKKAKAG